MLLLFFPGRAVKWGQAQGLWQENLRPFRRLGSKSGMGLIFGRNCLTPSSGPTQFKFGETVGRVEERSLVPLGARLGRIGFDERLRRSQAGA